MSLVEQALKKAKQSGQPVPLSTQAPPAPEPAAPLPGDVALPMAKAVVEGIDPTSVIEPSPEITSTVQPLHIVAIDREGLRASGYLPPVEQEREIAEQFRHVKRPLVSRALGRGQERVVHGNRIAVMSALQGEGKTFTAINLALSIALEKDVEVVLVDTDMIRPELSRVFGLKGQPGLIEALADASVDVASLVHHTDVPRLRILPAGVADHTAAEWLMSPRMDEVLRRLSGGSGSNTILVFDSPPLLVTNESKAVCDAAGQVVLVVRANETPQRAVLDAISHIGEGKHVGLVLNGSDTVAGVGYGYGYYGGMYQYGRTGHGA